MNLEKSCEASVKMLEFEKKILLSAEEYQFLNLHFFANAKTVQQNNYYFDTEKLELNGKKTTARIREINGTFKSMIKDHSATQADCSVENLCTTSQNYDDAYFVQMGLLCHGKLHTERKILVVGDVQLMLDKNDYLGVIDYELEIEYQAGFENNALMLIKQISDSLNQNALSNNSDDFKNRIGIGKTKSERFFERKITM